MMTVVLESRVEKGVVSVDPITFIAPVQITAVRVEEDAVPVRHITMALVDCSRGTDPQTQVNLS